MHSGDQKDGGDHLRAAGSNPRRLVVEVELGVAGDDLGGRRSSDEDELVGAVIVEARGELLCGLHGAVRLVGMVVWPLGGRSYVGDELRRRRVR